MGENLQKAVFDMMGGGVGATVYKGKKWASIMLVQALSVRAGSSLTPMFAAQALQHAYTVSYNFQNLPSKSSRAALLFSL